MKTQNKLGITPGDITRHSLVKYQGEYYMIENKSNPYLLVGRRGKGIEIDNRAEFEDHNTPALIVMECVETGKTPRQLAEENKMLLEAMRKIRIESTIEDEQDDHDLDEDGCKCSLEFIKITLLMPSAVSKAKNKPFRSPGAAGVPLGDIPRVLIAHSRKDGAGTAFFSPF